MASPIVIIGSGLGGYTLAREIRKRDKVVSLTILTADNGAFYSKPMLSAALAKGQTADALAQKNAEAMSKELNADILVHTRVVGIDRTGKSVGIENTDGRSTINYAKLVFAMGADPRIIPTPGSENVDIATVNDLGDYGRWRDRIAGGGHILLIGAGLIGCEFANDLTAAGYKVDVVDPAPWPLARLLPESLGNRLKSALEEIGATLHMGVTIVSMNKTDKGYSAQLSDGTMVAFDHALSAVGLTPRTRIAVDAGLNVGLGIRVDKHLQTSDPDIYAIGDCAETDAGPLPFVMPLMAEAKVLAATLTGERSPLHLPAMPVVVKTPAMPLVVCPPKPGLAGAWSIEDAPEQAVAIFCDENGCELGFVLTGAAVGQRFAMAKRMPDLIPA